MKKFATSIRTILTMSLCLYACLCAFGQADLAIAQPKSPNSVEDLIGLCRLTYFEGGHSSLGILNNPSLIKRGEHVNEIILPTPGGRMEATVDLESLTVIVKKQTSDGLILQPELLQPKEEDPYFLLAMRGDPVESVTGTITSECSIVFPKNVCFNFYNEGNPDETVCFPMIAPEYRRYDFFEYNAADWEYVGNAKFEEHLFSVKHNIEAKPYDVELRRHTVHKNKYILVNPYDNECWKPYNDADGKGSLIFDVTDPGCVMLDVMVPCGFADRNLNDDNTVLHYITGHPLTSYMPHNSEAAEAFSGHSIDIIKGDGFDTYEYYTTIPKLEEVSSYKEGVLTIANCMEGDSQYPIIYNGASTFSPRKSDYKLVITMPGTGVSETESDIETKTEYFNLQGIRIDNPQPGTVYIEHRGNKTVKRLCLKGN